MHEHRLDGCAAHPLAAVGGHNFKGSVLRPASEVRCDLGPRLRHTASPRGRDGCLSSFAGEATRDGMPDPPARIDDDCEFSGQSEFHQLIHCPPSTLKHCETM